MTRKRRRNLARKKRFRDEVDPNTLRTLRRECTWCGKTFNILKPGHHHEPGHMSSTEDGTEWCDERNECRDCLSGWSAYYYKTNCANHTCSTHYGSKSFVSGKPCPGCGGLKSAFDVQVEEYAKDNGLPMSVARRRVEYDLANDEVEF